MRRVALTLILLVALVSGCGKFGSHLETDDGISRSELMLLHNKERSLKGVQQLQYDLALEQRAQKHAEWMASNDSLIHSKLGGLDFMMMGENIAMGFSDSDSVTEGWMNSPGHRRNILNPKFTHAGFGYARKQGGVAFWCAQFGGDR